MPPRFYSNLRHIFFSFIHLLYMLYAREMPAIPARLLRELSAIHIEKKTKDNLNTTGSNK